MTPYALYMAKLAYGQRQTARLLGAIEKEIAGGAHPISHTTLLADHGPDYIEHLTRLAPARPPMSGRRSQTAFRDAAGATADQIALSGGVGHGRRVIRSDSNYRDGVTNGPGFDPARYAYRSQKKFVDPNNSPKRWVSGLPSVAGEYARGGPIDVFDAGKFQTASAWTPHIGKDSTDGATTAFNKHRVNSDFHGNSQAYERVVLQADLDRSYLGQLKPLPSGNGHYGNIPHHPGLTTDHGVRLADGDARGANTHLSLPPPSGIRIGEHGEKKWYRNDQLHREDGPAIDDADLGQAWYRNGQLHRDDGPAIEEAGGTKRWYRNDQLHREDGPAIERPHKVAGGPVKEWYRNGKLHREDGPALEFHGRRREWYRNGKLHREDGPAIEEADGWKGWYLDGRRQDPPVKTAMTPYDFYKIANEEIKRDRTPELVGFLSSRHMGPASVLAVAPGALIDATLFPYVVKGVMGGAERIVRLAYGVPEDGSTASI